jgi:thiol-disulfide isomerase/thioredoxin
LIVSDVAAARDELIAAGVEVSDIFHLGPNGPEGGPDPEHRTYRSFASFSDPDGNSWLLQEITTRLPGRIDSGVTSFGSTSDLASAFRRAEAAHGEARLVRRIHGRRTERSGSTAVNAGAMNLDRRWNMLIGIAAGIVVVSALVYVMGLSKLLMRTFDSSVEYRTSESTGAPELAVGDWINSEPLKLKGLHGRVVLIEFWTFGCYNCRNTLPFIKDWNDRYRDKGLTIIGVHSPEFDEERNVDNLRRQVASLGITYPVVTDNDFRTWKAYNVEAWPTIFLLDKQGRIRWMHVGEGAYDETEQLIQKLLAEKD